MNNQIMTPLLLEKLRRQFGHEFEVFQTLPFQPNALFPFIQSQILQHLTPHCDFIVVNKDKSRLSYVIVDDGAVHVVWMHHAILLSAECSSLHYSFGLANPDTDPEERCETIAQDIHEEISKREDLILQHLIDKGSL